MGEGGQGRGGGGGPGKGGGSGSYSTSYALDPAKVALYYARKLLRGKAAWRESEFMAAWQAAVPAPLMGEPAMLHGEVLIMRDEGADGE